MTHSRPNSSPRDPSPRNLSLPNLSLPNLTASARREAALASLSGLHAWLGASGLAAADVIPGLHAAIDQHAAAVVDVLCADGRPLTPVTLAGYAAGVRDGATERGWRIPDVTMIEWCRADWAIVRLLAVTSLARTARYL